MEFNCPACDAPHAFPDEQIPADGIVVACTSCATHITLDAPTPDAPEAEPELEPRPTLRAEDLEPAPSGSNTAPRPSVNAPMGGMDGGAPSFGRKEQESRPPPRPAGWPAPPPKPDEEAKPRALPKPMADSDPPAAIEDMDSAVHFIPDVEPAAPAPSDIFGKVADAAAGAARDVAHAGVRTFDQVSAIEQDAEADVPEGLAFPGFKPTADGAYTWRDLPRAFLGVVDLHRLGFTTVVFWMGILAFGLINWLGGLLADKVWGTFGTIFGVVAWLALIGSVLVVTSVMGFVCHQTVIEQRSSSIKAGVEWVQKWIQSVFGTPLAFVAVIAAVAAFHGLVGVIGRIPYAGPVVWGLASGVTIVSALAAGVVAVLLGYTLGLYIPVVYNEKSGPGDTLKRLLELARLHGATLVGLVVASVVMIYAAFWAILKPSILAGTLLLSYVGLKAMGPDLMATIAANPFQAIGMATSVLFEQLGGGMGVEVNIGHKLGGFFTAFFATGALAFVGALLYLPYITAGGIIYGVLTGRKKP